MESYSASAPDGAARGLSFDEPFLLQKLLRATDAELDDANFGVIGMTHDGIVRSYNRWESQRAGLGPSSVLGKHFFTGVARCADNEQVAGRLLSQSEVDLTLDYSFAFRLRVRPVRLRLLRSAAAERMYLIVAERIRL